jgi:predicted O-methyltransferase YrrM
MDGTTHQVFPISINRAEGEALRAWVIREHAVCTIEIGLAYGISALFICEGLLNELNNARHVVVDPYPSTGFKNCGLQLLEEAGAADLIEYHAAESQILLPRFLSEGRRFELAFIDGSHVFDRVFLDLIYLGRLVHPGGIIFVDDYQLPAIVRAVSFCLTNLGWVLEEVSPADELHHGLCCGQPAIQFRGHSATLSTSRATTMIGGFSWIRNAGLPMRNIQILHGFCT